MAQLKNTVISGSLRATDTLAAQTAQFKILNAPTTSNGTTYGPGSNGNFLKSNGTSIYWVNLAAADIPTISITDKTSGTLTVARGGTGATTAAGARTNLGLGSMATETAANYLKWRTTSEKSTELYDFGAYVNQGSADQSGPTNNRYFALINIPYRRASGNTIPDYSWQIGGNTDNNNRLWFRTAAGATFGNWQEIAHAPYSTNDIGSATQPVYMTKTGVITAGTALKALAYKDSLALNDITSADDLKAIEALTGTSGLLKKTAANTWTLDTNTYLTSSTGVTSIAGKTGAVELSDLGLSNAMHFLGVTTTDISTGTANTTATVTIGSSSVNATAGDVVLYNSAEYVWGNDKWNLLGDESSYALKATTLAGYNITDAKIANGVITLGNNTITPLTSQYTTHLYVNATEGGATSNATTANTTTYIHLYDTSTKRETIQLKGAGGTSITATGGVITITSANDDVKVKQTKVENDVKYKLLTTTSASPTTGSAAEAYYSTNITANPSTGSISARRHTLNFNGADKAFMVWNDAGQSIDFIFE